MLPLDDLKLRPITDSGLLGRRRFGFSLFNAEDPRKFVWKNHETLDLYAVSNEEMESWMASFLRAGVYPVNVDAEEVCRAVGVELDVCCW
jgi:dynamin GTPase